MSYRLDCADILDSLNVRHRRSAETLRWAERHEFGDPVPAAEAQERVAAAVAEAEQEWEDQMVGQIDDLRAERDVARSEIFDLRDLLEIYEPDALRSYDEGKAGKSKS